MLPIVYAILYHYANPVTGSTALVARPPMAEQLKEFPAPPPRQGPAGAAARAVPTAAKQPASPPGMPANIAAALREIGPKIDLKTMALYAPLHVGLNHSDVNVRRNLAYGPSERHRADVFTARDASGARPILVFVPGGGFARGDKSAPGQFYYDNIGYWAAEHGLVGVTINYRLAPEFKYPSGAEDVARALQWLHAHAREFGGDPDRIFVWGHSAGGAHVADYLVRTPHKEVAGAILMSGVYTAIPIWKSYYGDDTSRYPEESSLPRLGGLKIPLLVVNAELDPPNFVPDTDKLVAERKAAGTPTVVVHLPNHSHLSEAFAIGTADQSLSVPLLQFIKAPPR